MTRIALVRLTDKKYYGGYAYGNAILDALSKDFDVELINVGSKNQSALKYLEVPIVLWELFKLSRRSDFDIVIRNFESSLFLSKNPVKNVFSLFHIDRHHGPIHYKLFHLIFGKYILQKLKKVDASAVISEYWRRFLEKNGFKNVYVAYYPSNSKKFKFTIEEIEDFKSRFGLTDKPIIYLGVARRDKGVEESFNALKHLDYHFVTSADPSLGELNLKAPVLNLRLNRRDYLRLLKASSVAVAMSKITEGWCINVQEAMLCKTPVVGSGTGGMEELLEEGGQLVCKDFKKLQEKVKFAIIHHKELGERGYQFAKTFTFERFEQDWANVVSSLKDLK